MDTKEDSVPETVLATTSDVNRIEAPVTWKAYLVNDSFLSLVRLHNILTMPFSALCICLFRWYLLRI